jgi:hypothetical protein
LYIRFSEGQKRVVPIDVGAGELSPPYVLRIFRQFSFSDRGSLCKGRSSQLKGYQEIEREFAIMHYAKE